MLLFVYCGVLFFYGINTSCFYRTEALRAIVEHPGVETFEKAHAFLQCRLEVELAAHCTLGNGGNRRSQAHIVRKLIQALLLDNGRLHIGYE